MVNHRAQNMACYTFVHVQTHTETPYSALLWSNLPITPAAQTWNGGVEENAGKLAIHVDYLGILDPTG